MLPCRNMLVRRLTAARRSWESDAASASGSSFLVWPQRLYAWRRQSEVGAHALVVCAQWLSIAVAILHGRFAGRRPLDRSKRRNRRPCCWTIWTARRRRAAPRIRRPTCGWSVRRSKLAGADLAARRSGSSSRSPPGSSAQLGVRPAGGDRAERDCGSRRGCAAIGRGSSWRRRSCCRGRSTRKRANRGSCWFVPTSGRGGDWEQLDFSELAKRAAGPGAGARAHSAATIDERGRLCVATGDPGARRTGRHRVVGRPDRDVRRAGRSNAGRSDAQWRRLGARHAGGVRSRGG